MRQKIHSRDRSFLDREKGYTKKDWGGRLAVALIYPNHYSLGMSNLGFQIVYDLFNQKDEVVAERFFLPDSPVTSLHLQSAKGLLSLESQAPLYRFDLAAFSVSFENDYPNILKILELGKIPLPADERDESQPFVAAGGITTFLNPEPLAPFMDFFLLGEAEAFIDEFVDLFRRIRQERATRRDTLKLLAANLSSVYVPGLYRITYRRDGTIKAREPTGPEAPERIMAACQPSPHLPVRTSTILTRDTEFSNMMLIELGRGCGRSCRFCAAGFVYRPPRTHDESELIRVAGELVKEHHRFGLLSAAVSDTPGIERITDTILKGGGTFSVSSLRADSLTGELLDRLRQAGQRSVAIAPEAGSERLRRVINKHLTREQILRAVTLIAGTASFSLRLYFMIGLPTETPDDIAGIVELVKAIKHNLVKESRTRGKMGLIRLSVNCFIPKAFTPFQWLPMEEMDSLKEKQKRLKKELARVGGVKINFDVPRWAYVQTLLSMGDRRAGSILLTAHKHGGDWRRAFKFSETNPDFFVYRPRGLDENLPWDFIDHGISKEFLIKEYKLALKARESEPCRVGYCTRCGVCREMTGGKNSGSV